MKISIDTNLINARQADIEMNQIEAWEKQGYIKIVAGERFHEEVTKYNRKDASSKLLQIPNTSEPMVIGFWKLGAAYPAPDEKCPPDFFNRLLKIMFPKITSPENLSQNQANDILQLMSHYFIEANWFLTNNKKDFIDFGKKQEIFNQFSIIVGSPADFIQEFGSSFK